MAKKSKEVLTYSSDGKVTRAPAKATSLVDLPNDVLEDIGQYGRLARLDEVLDVVEALNKLVVSRSFDVAETPLVTKANKLLSKLLDGLDKSFELDEGYTNG